MDNIDRETRLFIEKHGLDDVLAAICRYCNNVGLEKTFKKLNVVYEWYIKAASR